MAFIRSIFFILREIFLLNPKCYVHFARNNIFTTSLDVLFYCHAHVAIAIFRKQDPLLVSTGWDGIFFFFSLLDLDMGFMEIDDGLVIRK